MNAKTKENFIERQDTVKDKVNGNKGNNKKKI